MQINLHGATAPAVEEIDLFGFPQAPAELSVVEVNPAALTNPVSGEIVDPESIDDLISCYEQIDRFDKAIYAVKQRIKSLLLAKTEGDAVTRRVQGEKRIAKLELPAESFDQTTLKQLWEQHPELAEQYLRIERLAVNMKDFKKLRGTSSDRPELVAFRDALTAASKGRTGSPTVTVEK